MIYEELSRQVIGASMDVLNVLRPGLDEKLYENALVIELAERGISADSQKSYPVHYKEHFIGKLIPDLIIEDKIVADTKIAESFNDAHLAQMLGYLAITGMEVGLLVNFKFSKLKWKRVVRDTNA